MRRFGYYWKEGFRNIFKHGFMSIAAVLIMIACLILTGTVTLIAYNIDLSIVELQQSNEIVVWIDDSLTTREARSLGSQFDRIDNIATIESIDRDEALEDYRQQLGDDADILEDFSSDNNPLRNSFVFTLRDPALADEARTKAAGHPRISHCYYRPVTAPDWPYTLYTMIHGKS